MAGWARGDACVVTTRFGRGVLSARRDVVERVTATKVVTRGGAEFRASDGRQWGRLERGQRCVWIVRPGDRDADAAAAADAVRDGLADIARIAGAAGRSNWAVAELAGFAGRVRVALDLVEEELRLAQGR